eukprot:SAG31_NODE_424_length_15826_cov_4.954664_4_plen_111_part_00
MLRRTVMPIAAGDAYLQVNVCSSSQVPEPPKITPEMLQDQKNPVRLPLSLGEPREDTDAKGKPCTVYDCVMHTDVLERTKTDAEMKEFVVELCLQVCQQSIHIRFACICS